MTVKRVIMRGNDALSEAAIRAGCRFFAGYPITPATEILEYCATHLPEVGGVCMQAESEVSAINMLAGASGGGTRCMTASTGPGISLMQEGIAAMAATQSPVVIVNMSRPGPGWGSLGPSQADYNQACKGGGYGDYHIMVLAPHTVQEMVYLTREAFHLADKHRIPVMIMGDTILAQAMEAVAFDEPEEEPLPPKDWATTGAKGRAPVKMYRTSHEYRAKVGRGLGWEMFEQRLVDLDSKQKRIQAMEARAETILLDDADVILVAAGTVARVAKPIVAQLRQEGIRAGLIRPITLWPFPSDVIAKAAERGKPFVTIEMSRGQMVDDVRLAVNGRAPVYFYGRVGGNVPSTAEISGELRKAVEGKEVLV